MHYMADSKEERKRTYRAVAIVFCIITIPLAILYFGYFQVVHAEKVILAQNSPNKKNQVEIRVRGQNAFFSNAPIRIHYGKIGHLRTYIEEKINNDGKTLVARNFEFTWLAEDVVTIILKGEEQKDKRIEIAFPD
ncbi:hypothetical protein [Paenibacillus sp. YIM B09110]|uniref:hypothetical protein n=1 Tax=Paenibacillus sp. YIM B09110 TaxID=3126102 RepID=UPI00301C05FF